MSGASRSFLVAAAASLALGYLGVGEVTSGPSASESVAAGTGGSVSELSGEDSGTGQGTPPQVSAQTPGAGKGLVDQPVAKPGLSCAPGRNGGRTDRGVTATRIRLAATVVLDGPAASLLRESPTGMKAVIDKVNAAGGICGRALELILRNDGFRADTGQQYIRNFINEDIFALAVVPSAEGLGAAIKSEDISRAGLPVVGTDGMRMEQYQDPWVWPVATATVSTMRIMATYAHRVRAARTFAIVWDSKYKFGIEGAQAFREQVRRLGGRILADQPLDPLQSSYASEVEAFNSQCKDEACDMVALLLLPDTAEKWMKRRPAMGARYTAGAQTLFTDQFAQACAGAAGALCHGLAVWTGYVPPIDRYAGISDVATYVNDVRAVAPNADVRNQFLEGAYLGMSVLAEAIRRAGPELTRQRLRTVLDSMDYRNQITAGLSWRPGRHHANVRARSFSMVLSGGNFLGWRDEQTGWATDPAFGG